MRKEMAKVKLNLSRLSPEQLLQQANDIKSAMTGNPNFPNPIPSLETVGGFITGSQAKVSEWNANQSAGQMILTGRNTMLDGLRACLSQLGSYVEAASAGDELKIQSAGMGVRGAAVSVGTPDQVTNLALTAGDAEGELDAQWDAVTGAKSYEIQISPDPVTSTSWVNRPSVTRSRVTLNSFTSGTRVWIRVRAIGSAGHGNWSEPVIKMVP
jgi:hypothetical protein